MSLRRQYVFVSDLLFNFVVFVSHHDRLRCRCSDVVVVVHVYIWMVDARHTRHRRFKVKVKVDKIHTHTHTQSAFSPFTAYGAESSSFSICAFSRCLLFGCAAIVRIAHANCFIHFIRVRTASTPINFVDRSIDFISSDVTECGET